MFTLQDFYDKRVELFVEKERLAKEQIFVDAQICVVNDFIKMGEARETENLDNSYEEKIAETAEESC
jgi:hypothetical protein